MEIGSIQDTLAERAANIARRTGDTPLVRVKNLLRRNGVELWVKTEWEQIGGSVKARAAFRIMNEAIRQGILDETRGLLDATSGNTGIAYAAIGRELGIPVTLCLPENASKERKEILASLGAVIIYTSRFEGTDGAQQQAAKLAREFPEKYFYADQYNNGNNWKAHYEGTAIEIFQELPGITHFAAGLGTTGTFVGTGRRLRELKPGIRLVSFQPDTALHGLEGWKHLETAKVPGIYDPLVADSSLTVSTEEAYEMIGRAAKEEGWMLSPSSAANLAGAIRLAETISTGKIVTILPDNADKYSEIIQKLM
jgi:cysteine synthase B